MPSTGVGNGERTMATKKVFQTNLKVIEPSRKPLRPGDIFAMQIPNGRYLFGRVIEADLPEGVGPLPRSNLIYIYAGIHETMRPDLSRLVPSNLLLQPLFTNRLGWSKGYFKTVANEPIQESDRLKGQHFFHHFTRKYFDVGWKEVPASNAPGGDWGVVSYRRIDDLISDALGLPRVPVEEE